MSVVTITGQNITGGGGDVEGGDSLTNVGAVPYVTAAATLGEDGSFLRTATGRYTLFDPTAGTGDTKFVVKSGALQSSNLIEAQDVSGTAIVFITPSGTVYSRVISMDGWWTLSQTSTGGISFGSGHAVAWGGSGTNASSSAVSGDTALARNAAGIVEVNNGTAGTIRDLKFRNRLCTVGVDIASAATIAPTESVHIVTGVVTISTITPPSGFAVANSGGQITLIPTGLWATNTAGNIALATTAVVGRALTLTYNNTTSKWYPSY